MKFYEIKKPCIREDLFSRIKAFQKLREDLISQIWAKFAKICTLKVSHDAY